MAKTIEQNDTYWLRNINEKIRLNSVFKWKILFGWIIAVPVILIGALFDAAFQAPFIAAFFYVVGLLIILVNFIIGIIALHQATKDL